MTAKRTPRSIGAWHVGLALVSLAAAAIHFAVIGEHFDESFAFGLFFAIVAWAQALWAVGILTVPGRPVLLAGLLGNLVVVAIWTLSRTSGVPIGPEPWTAEAIGAADVMSTILELAIIVGCGVLLVRGSDRPVARPATRAPIVALGVSLAVLTSVAIATAGGHAHTGSEASGHDHAAASGGHGDSADAAADGHAHELAGGSGEPDLAQIDLVRSAMAKYEDVKFAEANGWHKEHRDWPELGAHFYHDGDWAGAFPARPALDLNDPEFLMYSRFLTGEWKLVAVAYVVDQAQYPSPPTNLTGATYHEHVWNCIDNGEELEEEDWGVISKEECNSMGGRWSPGGVWMTHVWLVDNPNGIFAETNPRLV